MQNTSERDPMAGRLWRIIYWSGTAILLCIPALAMQFTSEVDWTTSDFVFAAIIFGLVGGALEWTVRASTNWTYRAAMAVTILMSFLTTWSNMAVGIIGNEDNPLNLLFFAGLAALVLGGAAFRFRARAMSVLTALQAGLHLALGVYVGSTLMWYFLGTFALMWLVAAVLFLRCSQEC
ncbi:hypothetical protein [Qipengyuania sp. JC766]|uniref:hypothetical protein n=1 Tax=Qipengyuania sp. JC766 TaxID=3232139 RepID=UPI0034588EF2